MSPMLSCHPFALPDEWRAFHACVIDWTVKRKARLRHAVAVAEDIRGALNDLGAMMEAIGRDTCPQCASSCCLTASVWFDFRDLIYLHLTGLPLPPAQIQRAKGAPCPHLCSQGCVLPRPLRPYICTWYLCAAQRAALSRRSSAFQARIHGLLTRVGTLRKSMETEFLDALA